MTATFDPSEYDDTAPEAIVIQQEDIPTPESTDCLLYTSPSPRDGLLSRMPSSA